MRTPILYSVLLLFAATAAAALCLTAEFRKSKKSDLRFDGKMCSLPQSSALGLGIAALITLFTGQIAGNFFAYREFRLVGGRLKARSLPFVLLVLSWVSFVIAAILLSTASGMSRSQPAGEGWLDGECYLVKNGVYGGSAFLALLALGSALGAAVVAMEYGKTR